MPENKITTNLGRVSLVPRGTYDPAATYTRLDYVRFGDDGYLARRSGLRGVTPADGEDWMLAVGSGSAKMARSWAVGGSGERPEEDTDNAKYYAGQARESAGSAAGSVQVLEDNREAIQSIRDNLADIQAVSENREAVRIVSGQIQTVQTVGEHMADVQTVVENLEAIQGAPDAAERAEAADDDANLAAERAEEAANRAQSIAQGAKGYYETPETLRESVPEGTAGDWAIVGSTDTVWVWDKDTEDWKDSHQATDLSNYYTKDQADAENNKLLANITQATDGKLTELSGTLSGQISSLEGTVSTGLAGKLGKTEAAAKVAKALSFTGGASGSYDGSEEKTVDIPALPGPASEDAPGLMSAEDKQKLNGIAAGAQVNAVTSVSSKTGAVTLKKADLGLGSVDNTADSAKNVATAARLATPQTINGVSFDGSAPITVYDSTKQPRHKTLSLTLAAATWSESNTYTVTATGVTAGNTVIVSPAPASFEAWCEAEVRCTAQGADSLTFTAADKPAADLTAQVLILD